MAMLDIVTITKAEAFNLVRELNAVLQYLPLPGAGYDLIIRVQVDKQGRRRIKSNVRLPQPDLAYDIRENPEPVDGLELEELSFMREVRRPMVAA